MGVKIYQAISFNKQDYEIDFDKYLKGELPDTKLGCIYIFTKLVDGNKPEYHHIGYTEELWKIIDEKNILELHDKDDSNCLFIHKSNDIKEMELLTDIIKKGKII